MEFDDHQKVWLGTARKGLFLFDPAKKSSELFFNEVGDSLGQTRNNFILDILDYPDHLLLGTRRGGLWRFDKKTKVFSRPSSNVLKSTYLSNGIIGTIFPRKDHYWFALPFGLIKTDLDFNIVQEFEWPPDTSPVSVDQDNSGTFWVATNGQGILAFDPATKIVSRYKKNESDPQGLASDMLNTVFVDKNQNIWFGTYDKGFEQIKGTSITFHNLYLPGRLTGGLPHIIKSAGKEYVLQESKLNGLWVADLQSPYDKIIFREVLTNPGFAGVHTTTSTLGKNYWWIGTWKKGVVGVPLDPITRLPGKGKQLILDSNPLNKNTIQQQMSGPHLEDDQGFLWLTAPQNVLYKYDTRRKYGSPGAMIRYAHSPADSSTMSQGAVFGVIQESSESILVLTQSGLDRLTGSKFEHLYVHPKGTDVFTFLKRDDDGKLLIGSTNGLLFATPENTKFKFEWIEQFRGKQVWIVEDDKLGRYWVSTTIGIFCYDPKDASLFQFKKEDGLSDTEPMSNAHARTGIGQIIFASGSSLIFQS